MLQGRDDRVTLVGDDAQVRPMDILGSVVRTILQDSHTHLYIFRG